MKQKSLHPQVEDTSGGRRMNLSGNYANEGFLLNLRGEFQSFGALYQVYIG